MTRPTRHGHTRLVSRDGQGSGVAQLCPLFASSQFSPTDIFQIELSRAHLSHLLP